AVQEALLFKIGGHVYAVPSVRVEETLDVTPADVTLGAEERLRFRGQSLPLVRLGALLGVPPPPGASERRAALVLSSIPPAGSAGRIGPPRRCAPPCDKLIGPREIVVRSLGPLLSRLPLYAGATISGAGKVQLILDVARLAQIALEGMHAARPE